MYLAFDIDPKEAVLVLCDQAIGQARWCPRNENQSVWKHYPENLYGNVCCMSSGSKHHVHDDSQYGYFAQWANWFPNFKYSLMLLVHLAYLLAWPCSTKILCQKKVTQNVSCQYWCLKNSEFRRIFKGPLWKCCNMLWQISFAIPGLLWMAAWSHTKRNIKISND